MSQKSNDGATDSQWVLLYKIGGAAALLMAALIVAQALIYIVWPPPDTATEFFALFQNNPLLGLLSLDLIYLIDNALMVPIYLALYMALRRSGESLMALGLALGFIGLAAYYASNSAFEIYALSNQYAAAATDAEQTALLGAGQAMLAIYRGTAFNVYYVLNCIALLLFSIVMLRSRVFSRATGYLALLAGLLMIVPSTAGIIGLVSALLSLVPWTIWLILFARRMFQLAQ
jgi:hypothetical protein